MLKYMLRRYTHKVSMIFISDKTDIKEKIIIDD